MRFVVKICGAGHYESGSAEAALLRVVVPKGSGHCAEIFSGFKTFDGGDFAALGVDGKCCAGIDGAAVDMNGACSASCAVADFFCASEVKMISQGVEKHDARFEFERLRFAVDFQRDGNFARADNVCWPCAGLREWQGFDHAIGEKSACRCGNAGDASAFNEAAA